MRATELIRKFRRIINPPYSSKNLPIIVATLLILISIPLTTIAVQTAREIRSRAAGNTLYLSPASQSINQGVSFTVQVRENSNTDQISTVHAVLNYDATYLDFVSIDTSGSAFGWQLDNTGGGGTVTITRGVTPATPPQPVTGDQLVATVNFTAKHTPGATAVSFAAESGAAKPDGNDAFKGGTGGTYTVVDPPPTVSITSPASGVTIKGTVNVTATASDDAAGGVTQVEFLVDGSSKSIVTTAPYQYSLNTTTLTDGAHTISAKAYDAHNTTTSTPINVTVDNNAPTVSISYPTDGSYVKGTVTVTTTYNDAAGVTKIEYYLDAGASPTYTANTAPFNFPWNTTTYSNAAHPLQAKAYDKANNMGASTAISVTVDNIVPTVSITSPANGAYLRGSVNATANPNDTNLLNVQFYLNTTLKCTVTSSPFTCANIITTSTSDGPYTIYATANDKAGNSATSSVPVTVDNTAPTAPSGLTATAVSSSRIDLTWIASTDVTSGIAGYDVYRGGAKVNSATVTTTSYSDTTGLSPATSYTYYVVAVDKGGNNSANSNNASAKTLTTCDLNGDIRVNVYDLSVLLTRWGSTDAAADLSGNGKVDILDIGSLVSCWGP